MVSTIWTRSRQDRKLNNMKELFRKEGESVVVNGDIYVKVREIHDDEVVLEIETPDWVEVVRAEREVCATLFPR